MSSGPQSVRDDEIEWEQFIFDKGLDGMTMFCTSEPYCSLACFAREGYTKYKLVGVFLAQYVRASTEYHEAHTEYANLITKLVELQATMKRMESDLAGDASARSKRSGA